MKKVFEIVFSACFLLLLCSCGVDPLTVEIACTGETNESGDTYFSIQTNLPDNTNLIVTVSGASNNQGNYTNTSYNAQSEAVVEDGLALAGPFSNGSAPLIMGDYNITITVPYAGEQPQNVQRRIGEKGENLQGEFVIQSENDGKYVEYKDAWQMQNLSETLSEREYAVFKGALENVILHHTLPQEQVEYQYSYFLFTEVVVNNVLPPEEWSEVIVDYATDIYDNVTGEERTIGGEDQILFLKSVGELPPGILLDDQNLFNQSGMNSLYGDVALELGIAATCEQEELDHINTALNQFIGWIEMEKPLAEDIEKHGAFINR